MITKANFLGIIFTLVLLTSLTLAAHIITTSTGTTFYNINDSTQTTFNISVDNTDPGQPANITQVNITIPSQFTFTAGTNGTNVSTSTFQNTTTILSWSNTATYLINGSESRIFWFNATTTPGSYNITITTTNATASYSSNISVQVNDTTSPTTSLGNPIDNYNSSNTNVTFNIKCTDAYSPNDLVLYGNWSTTWHANQTNASTTNDTFWSINISNIPDGKYKWSAYCNDTAGNSDWATNRTLTIDTTNPSASASCSPSSANIDDTVTCSCSGTDATSGISTTTDTETPDTETTGTFTYDCTVTDFAGNSDDDDDTYTITTDNTGSGSGSGSSTSTNFWTKGTYVLTDKQFTESFTKEMSAKERIRVTVNSQAHYIGIIELTSTTATINISSDPQQAILTIGNKRLFEVSDDEYYDISVKLNSINNSKANITVQSTHELITENTTAIEETLQITGAATKEEDIETTEKLNIVGTVTAIVIIIIILVISIIIYGKNFKSKKTTTPTKKTTPIKSQTTSS